MTNKNNKEKDPRTHTIIGAAMEVHREMGPGFLEAVYHECLEIEFQIRKIPYISKPRLKLYYKIGHPWPIFLLKVTTPPVRHRTIKPDNLKDIMK